MEEVIANVKCENCNELFDITKSDSFFYKKMKVPNPTCCPACRFQRRTAFRNERYLYHRSCDLCGVKVISAYPEDSEFTVYCNDCWWSDKWDIMDYGMDYDFSQKFFSQYYTFTSKIPRFALNRDRDSINCKYTNYGMNNKSCYLALCAYSEDIYYSHGLVYAKSCMDCQKCMGSELCYDCIDCNKCYHLLFSKDCNNCSDSYFLEDCVGCSNCFASVGLRNKKFVFENEQLSEDEYKKKLEKVEFTNEKISKFKERLREKALKTPKKFMHGINNQNVTGDYIDNCKNLKRCFDALNEAENCAYCDFVGVQAYDTYDCSYGGVNTQLCYEVNGCTTYQNCKFAYYGKELRDSEYCQYCSLSKHLFGCFGLSYKEYCVFNKKYSEKDYYELVGKIIEQMKKDGEYGEFFPIQGSDYAYNESVASEYYPMTKGEVLAKGWKWRDKAGGMGRDESGECLHCKVCNGAYKTMEQELNFYENMKLPIPDVCPECRHKKRFIQRNPRQLFTRNCMHCSKQFETAYSPETPQIIYCEDCYLKEN